MKKVEENTIQNKIHKAESCGHTVEYVGKMEKAAPSQGGGSSSAAKAPETDYSSMDFSSKTKPSTGGFSESPVGKPVNAMANQRSTAARSSMDQSFGAQGSKSKPIASSPRDRANKRFGTQTKPKAAPKGLSGTPFKGGEFVLQDAPKGQKSINEGSQRAAGAKRENQSKNFLNNMANMNDKPAGGIKTAPAKTGGASNRPPLPPTAKIGDGSTNNLSPKQRNTDVAGAQKQAANKPKRSAFGQAFDTARAAGDKEFTWKNPKTGKTGIFHTRHKGEKSNPFARQQKQKAKEQAPAKANVAPAKKESISSRTNPDNQFNKMNPAQQQNMKQAYSNADRQGKVQQKSPNVQQLRDREAGGGRKRSTREAFNAFRQQLPSMPNQLRNKRANPKYSKQQIRDWQVARNTGSGDRGPKDAFRRQIGKNEENSMEKLKKFMEQHSNKMEK